MTLGRDILDSIHDMIVFALDCEYRYVYFNKAHAEAMRGGYGTEIALDRPVIDFITKAADRVVALSNFERVLSGEAHSNVEVYGDNERSHFESIYNPVFNSDGEIVGASCFARDISARVRAEKAFSAANVELEAVETKLVEQERAQLRQSTREADERYRRIVETTEEGIWTIGADALTDFVNRRMAEMMGYIPEEMIGRPLGDFMAEELRPHAADNIKRRERGISEQHEFCFLHKSGAEVHLAMTSNPITNADGVYVGAMAMARDVTAGKRAEADKARLESQLEQARKLESVGRLAGGVAHDFNNMLGVIIGHASLALDEVDDTHPLYADLLAIRDAAERSAEVTRQLLTVARKQAIKPQVVDLSATVGRILKLIRRLLGENLQLEWAPDVELWRVRIDPSQLDQMVTNLCANARDSIDDIGTIRIATKNWVVGVAQASNHAEAVVGDYVCLTVADTGSGIPPEVLPHIFEPFFTTKGIGKGTGLGLASVYGSVTQSGGFIEVTSQVGQGTTFHVYLPRCHEATAVAAPSMPLRIAGGVETILLVEDEQAVLNLATRVLVAQGYRVLSAGSPGEALSRADAYEGVIALLVTDVIMPEMNGRDLSELLAARRPSLKTLFMSGYTADLIPLQGVLTDGRRFIQKPFSINELVLMVRGILDGQDG